jgi:PAS domain-containing protein
MATANLDGRDAEVTSNSVNTPIHAGGRLVVDEDGTIVSCDATCEELFEAPEKALVGRHISKLVPKLGAKRSRHGWLSPNVLFLSHCDIPFRTRRFDGTPFISALYFSPLANDELGRTQLLVRDITPQARFEFNPPRAWGGQWCVE